MAAVDTGDLKTGFWLGLGLIGALIAWGLVSLFLARLRGARDG